MGLRFRRTLRLAPGLRLLLHSDHGPTLSLGPRHANLRINRRGAHSHAGVPGSGVYHRQRLWDRKKTRKKRR